jgi:hypothetical protein
MKIKMLYLFLGIAVVLLNISISGCSLQVVGDFYPKEPDHRNKRVFVFVPGFKNDIHGTWFNDSAKTYFYQLVYNAKSGVGKDSDIFLIGYPSGILDTTSLNIHNAAACLSEVLEKKVKDYSQTVLSKITRN